MRNSAKLICILLLLGLILPFAIQSTLIDVSAETKASTNAAAIYECESGIVNPPVVVQEISDKLPSASGERAAIVMVSIDKSMNVISKDGKTLTSVASFIDTYRSSVIPAFIIDSDAEATALASIIHEKELIDCYVIAKKSNASLVKKVRLANATTAYISGAIIFDDLNSEKDRKEAVTLVRDNMSYVAISGTPLSEESAFYFAARQVGARSYAENTAGVYTGLAHGYHGIISSDVSFVYDVYESITATTVSGRPVIIAHRGANDKADVAYPENTIMGMRAAKEKYGVDAVELDFGLSKDGYAILMHDDTVDRTTNGTGNFSDLTLAELKALSVDYVSGKKTTIATLEEAIQLALEIDLVLYCHLKTETKANIAVFSYLVDKYNAHDRVLLFGAAHSVYHSNNESVTSSNAYGFKDQAVITDGIGFSGGNQELLKNLSTHLDGVVAMKKSLTKYNYQPLFYQYSKQGAMWGEESFYYQLSARGFVNSHSITDGEANMANTALTVSGSTGFLTNNLQYSKDYYYKIDVSSEKLTLNVGEKIASQRSTVKLVGKTKLSVGVVQLDGPELVNDGGRYTLNSEGQVTVVYYAERYVSGNTSYRIYSEPVTLTFVSADTPEASTDTNSDSSEQSPVTDVPDTTPPQKNSGCASYLGAYAAFASVILTSFSVAVLKKRKY